MKPSDIHELNRRRWEIDAPGYHELAERDGAWRRLVTAPELAFEGQALETIREHVGGDLHGKKVLVVGSGDNYAAFALAGLGADVTSVDICQTQLDRAALRAGQLGLKLRFQQADAANLAALPENEYDLVFSSNGFHVWIADLTLVFGQITQRLRRGGHYIFYDVHPFQRPWKNQVRPLEMEKPYADAAIPPENEPDPGHEFHWTMATIVDALVRAGLTIRAMHESPAVNSRFRTGPSYGEGTDESLQDWRVNPRAGIPVWLTMAAQK